MSFCYYDDSCCWLLCGFCSYLPDRRGIHSAEPEEAVSFDSWEEILDSPLNVGIIRAHTNKQLDFRR